MYLKITVLGVVFREACVFERQVSMCVRVHCWNFSREDSPRLLIGAGGKCRSDWPERVQAFGVLAGSDQ